MSLGYRIPSIFFEKDYSSLDISVYALIVSLSKEERMLDVKYPNSYLAKRLGCSRRSLFSSFQKLVSRNLIWIDEQKKKTKGFTSRKMLNLESHYSYKKYILFPKFIFNLQLPYQALYLYFSLLNGQELYKIYSDRRTTQKWLSTIVVAGLVDETGKPFSVKELSKKYYDELADSENPYFRLLWKKDKAELLLKLVQNGVIKESDIPSEDDKRFRYFSRLLTYWKKFSEREDFYDIVRDNYHLFFEVEKLKEIYNSFNLAFGIVKEPKVRKARKAKVVPTVEEKPILPVKKSRVSFDDLIYAD